MWRSMCSVDGCKIMFGKFCFSVVVVVARGCQTKHISGPHCGAAINSFGRMEIDYVRVDEL